MLQQGFLVRKTRSRKRRLPLVSLILAGAGVGMIAGRLVPMIPHLGRAGWWSHAGSPLVLAGVWLLYISLWIGLARRRTRFV